MSPGAVLEMIRRSRGPVPRLAAVTAVATSPQLTVTCTFEDGSQAFQPLVLGSAATPTVGNRALLVPSDAGWIYLGTVLTPPEESPYVEQHLQIYNNWQRAHRADGTWYQLDHGYLATGSYTGAQSFEQGHLPSQAGGDGQTPSVFFDAGAILSHQAPQALAALAAQGATVQLVDMQIRRNAGGPDLVQPVMYGHAYDNASPPNGTVAPTWAPGFGPLRLAPIGRHETGRYVLPATWVTALAASTIKGIGFWAETTSDAMFSDRVYGGRVVAPMNLLLRVVASAPS